MKKMFSVFLVFLLLMVIFSMNAFALSNSTYTDLSSTSSQASNLLSYAMNFDNFLYSDFVIYQSAQYSYFIVWADKLTYENGVVTSEGSIQYVSYVRADSSYNYNWQYGESADFTLSVNHMTISNVDGLGFKSSLFNEYIFFDNFKNFSIFGLAALLVVAVCSLRKVFNK